MLRPGPRWGANSIPQTSWVDFGERKGKGKGGKGKLKKERGRKKGK